MANYENQEFTLYAAFDRAASGMLVEAYRAKRANDAPTEITEVRHLVPFNAPFSFSGTGDEWKITSDWEFANSLIAVSMSIEGIAEQIDTYHKQKSEQVSTLVRELRSGQHNKTLTPHSLGKQIENGFSERPAGYIETGPIIR